MRTALCGFSTVGSHDAGSLFYIYKNEEFTDIWPILLFSLC